MEETFLSYSICGEWFKTKVKRKPESFNLEKDGHKISRLAWDAERSRQNLAHPRRSLFPVGAAVASPNEMYYSGGNQEVRWQASYHAEEIAIITAVMYGRKVAMICVAADRSLFTPCGRCLDLLKEFGTPDCIVAHYWPSEKSISIFTLNELIPFYPEGDTHNYENGGTDKV